MKLNKGLVSIFLICVLVQFISATFVISDFNTPNGSTYIARNIISKGSYEGGTFKRLLGNSGYKAQRLFFFNLPGEPLYIAFWFHLTPEKLHKYIHIPVVLILIFSVAYVASFLGGKYLGICSALLGTFEPFIILHGPVWDDTFLSAALVWLVVAMLCFRLKFAKRKQVDLKQESLLSYFVIFFASLYASITRADSRLVFFLIIVGIFTIPHMRIIIRSGLVIFLAMLVGMGLWSYRNLNTVGEFTPSFSNFGPTFWESESPYTLQALKLGGQVSSFPYSSSVIKERLKSVANMTEAQIDQYFSHKAIAYIVSHPMDVLKISSVKLAYSFLGIKPKYSLLNLRNIFCIISNILIFSFAYLGFFYLRKNVNGNDFKSVIFIFSAIALTVIITGMFGPVGLRYHIMFDGVLWITAGAACLRGLISIKCPKGAHLN